VPIFFFSIPRMMLSAIAFIQSTLYRSIKVKPVPKEPNSGYSRMTIICQTFPMSPATVWRKTKEGTFPEAHKLSEGITAWKNSDLADWAENPMNYKSKR
jgi:predicted DNA-binding transcriptional regulator AlpA